MKKIIRVTPSHSSSAPAHTPQMFASPLWITADVCVGAAQASPTAQLLQREATPQLRPPLLQWGKHMGVKVTRRHTHTPFSQDNPIPIFLLQILCNRWALQQEQGRRRSLPTIPPGYTCRGSP